MAKGTHHWRSGDISGAPVMSPAPSNSRQDGKRSSREGGGTFDVQVKCRQRDHPMISRRTFIAGVASSLVAPLVAEAQARKPD
jgi:hypothetical protein